MSTLFADIAFPTAVREVFTYQVPENMNVEEGMRVWVPLRNEKAIGMVVRVHTAKPDFRTRFLLRVLDTEPVMDRPILDLTEWMHRFYYCSWGEAIQAALPVGLNFISEKILRVNRERLGGLAGRELEMAEEVDIRNYPLKEARKRWKESADAARLKKLIKKGVLEIWEQPKQKTGYRTARYWQWAEGADSRRIDEVLSLDGQHKWTRALEKMTGMKLPVSHRSLLEREGFSDYTLRRIEKEGLISSVILEEKTTALSDYAFEPEKIRTLSKEQQEVFDTIRQTQDNESFGSFLLYGVTGSGKTEVYIHALKHALEQGRGGMVLVPEIVLTPQTVRRFYEIFGDRIAVIHSRLNDRERFEAWTGLRSGEKRVVIGPRSAVFAPVRDLGLIIVDEEHDGSYKQFDPAPRYHARDVALVRARSGNAVVIMGSATPSMVALQGVRNKKHVMLQLTSRPSGEMPGVKVLDMKQYHSAMRGPLTVELFNAIYNAIKRGEQIILLYNRRGFASYLQCEECGHIPQSPDCSVSLTYHRKKNMLLCHYSGYARRADHQCESCGSDKLNMKGSGTEQIEEEIGQLFPGARLLRMDRDTTSGKYAHQQIYEKFLGGEADILIGTQLVSKGLDFPNVTVVGVLSAETELAFPSFRSGERMYQLLSQVAGRAGRGIKTGHVYVQTWKPEHRSIYYAGRHDYRSFAAEELAERKLLAYPPFSRMIVFHFRGASESVTSKVADTFTDAMRAETSGRVVLGPSPSVIEWMNGLFQWEALVKIKPGRSADFIEMLIDRIFSRYEADKPKGASGVRITVNVDAIE